MTDAAATTSPPPPPRATRLAIPLVAYFFISNAIGIAVLAMIGHLGDSAVAAMGIGNVAFSFLMALIYGFDTGVQALASRATGAGARDLAGRILTEALAVSIPLGVVLAAACAAYGPRFVALLTQDHAVAAQAGAYLIGAAPSLIFIAATTPFNSYWISTGVPRITFFVTAITVPAQIALAWPLVLGAGGMHGYGVGGAGLAVTAGTFLGLIIQFALGFHLRPIEGLFRHRPRIRGILAIIAIGWPVSAQQSLVQLGSLLAYVIIAHLSVASVAIFNVLLTLTLVPIQTATGIGTACGTLVGQALGRGDVAAAKRWGWRLMWIGSLLLAPLGLVAAADPDLLLSFFLHDPKTLALADLPARLVGLFVGIDAAARILSFALRGAGATKVSTVIPFFLMWVVQLPLIYVVGIQLHYGLIGMTTVQVSLTAVELAALVIVWSRARWARTGLMVMHRRSAAQTGTGVGVAPSRVAILGGAGAGKSTLARQIGAKLDLPVIHLDRLVFGPDWVPIDTEKVRAALEAQLGARWVTDGTYPQLSDLIFPKADLVIWIEQPALKRLWRAWRKTRIHRNAPRADRPDGAGEGFSLGYARTILSFGRFTPEVEARLKQATPSQVIVLKGDRAVANFLRALPDAKVVKLAA